MTNLLHLKIDDNLYYINPYHIRAFYRTFSYRNSMTVYTIYIHLQNGPLIELEYKANKEASLIHLKQIEEAYITTYKRAEQARALKETAPVQIKHPGDSFTVPVIEALPIEEPKQEVKPGLSFPKLMDANAAAIYLNSAYSTLALYRSNGSGPKYYLEGRKVMYYKEDLDHWCATRVKYKRRSTTIEG